MSENKDKQAKSLRKMSFEERLILREMKRNNICRILFPPEAAMFGLDCDITNLAMEGDVVTKSVWENIDFSRATSVDYPTFQRNWN